MIWSRGADARINREFRAHRATNDPEVGRLLERERGVAKLKGLIAAAGGGCGRGVLVEGPAVQAARLAAQVAKELIAPTRRRSLHDVPASARDLTAEWLTAVLCREAPGAAVVEVEVLAGSAGTSTRTALRVGYNAAGRQAGLPTRLFVKTAANFQQRLLLMLGGLAESETIFFRHIRPELDRLRSPRAYHAAFDPRTFRSIVVMDDLSSQGWAFPDPMRETITRNDAEDMVDQMAYYHAAFWDGQRLTRERSRLPTSELFQRRLNRFGFQHAARIGIERGRSAISPAVYRRKQEIFPAAMRSLRINSTGWLTLLHQDVHQGNWLRDREGRMGLYDWQAVATGESALDYTYALAVNLRADDRRAWEHDLLERYLWRLGEEGVNHPPAFEHAWLRYRQQPFHVLIWALATIGAGGLQPKDYMLRWLQRIATFVDEHQSLDSLL
jgi:thiamine kinase-like enzyme